MSPPGFSKSFGVVAALPVAALAIAACGGSSGSSSSTSSAAAAPTSAASTTAPTAAPTSASATSTPAAAPAIVGTATSGSLGSILVDSQGRTLYLFQMDTGRTSTCTGACASAWPPLAASGTLTAGGSANTSLLGSSARSDGTMQVTYNGHPLYHFSGDSKAGDTNGQGVNAFGARWYVISPAGVQVTRASSSPTGTNLGY